MIKDTWLPEDVRAVIFAENSQLRYLRPKGLLENDNQTFYVMPGMRFELEKCAGDANVVRLPSFDTRIGGKTLRELRAAPVLELPDCTYAVGIGYFAASAV